MVGFVLANNSDCASLRGLIKKYVVDETKLMRTITAKFQSERLNKRESLIPTATPIPLIGPISGDINMAPIITAVEFTFKPTDATTIAQANSQAFAPLNSTDF